MRSPALRFLLVSSIVVPLAAPSAAQGARNAASPERTPAPAAPRASAGAPAAAPPSFPTRAIRIGPSFQVLLFRPFEQTAQLGTGLFGAYEFYLTPAFALGINLSYRFHPGAEPLHQLGYGLLLKHYLAGARSPDAVFMPFLAYGLLLQMSFQGGHEGNGTSHDTRLSAGTDLRLLGTIFFIEGAWHYSRLGLFEGPTYKLDSVEIDAGWRYSW
jgi:hypothetical protein